MARRKQRGRRLLVAGLLVGLCVAIAALLAGRDPAVRRQLQIERARQSLSEGREREAIVVLRAAIERDSETPELYHALGPIPSGQIQRLLTGSGGQGYVGELRCGMRLQLHLLAQGHDGIQGRAGGV